MRKIKFINGKYYHIFNRGVDKRDVFLEDGDFVRFLKSMREFNNVKPIGSLYEKNQREKHGLGGLGIRNPSRVSDTQFNNPLVEIICYCLNPNHYHFLLRQLIEGGISEFMKRIGIGYTNYFNNKYNRSGVLFQGKFKTVKIESNEHLLWVSAYVNTNAQIHGLINKAENYPWCSYPDYLGQRNGALCHKEIILNQFKNPIQYQETVKDWIPLMKEKKELQKYLIE